MQTRLRQHFGYLTGESDRAVSQETATTDSEMVPFEIAIPQNVYDIYKGLEVIDPKELFSFSFKIFFNSQENNWESVKTVLYKYLPEKVKEKCQTIFPDAFKTSWESEEKLYDFFSFFEKQIAKDALFVDLTDNLMYLKYFTRIITTDTTAFNNLSSFVFREQLRADSIAFVTITTPQELLQSELKKRFVDIFIETSKAFRFHTIEEKNMLYASPMIFQIEFPYYFNLGDAPMFAKKLLSRYGEIIITLHEPIIVNGHKLNVTGENKNQLFYVILNGTKGSIPSDEFITFADEDDLTSTLWSNDKIDCNQPLVFSLTYDPNMKKDNNYVVNKTLETTSRNRLDLSQGISQVSLRQQSSSTDGFSYPSDTYSDFES